MRDPYLILGVSPDADDEMIHAAFLEATRRCPPDRDPEAYDERRKAYEALRTRRDRLAYELFDRALPDPRDILDRCYPVAAPERPGRDLFQALLRGER